MARETRHRDKLAKCLPGLQVHAQRVENIVGPGTPDDNYCVNGREFWVEWKQCSKPVRATTLIKPKFRPAQGPWIKHRLAAGGEVYIGICLGVETFFVHGSHFDLLEKGVPYSTLKSLHRDLVGELKNGL